MAHDEGAAIYIARLKALQTKHYKSAVEQNAGTPPPPPPPSPQTAEYDGGMEARLEALEKAVADLPTKADFAGLRADMADGRADIHKMIADNQRWTHSALVAIISLVGVGLVGLVLTFWNATRSLQAASSAPVAQPPIIINVPSAPAPASPASR